MRRMLLLAQNAVPPVALPDWMLTLVFAGTIIAAVIGAVNAIVVAGINFAASRYLANNAAHLERRKEVAQASLAEGRALATAARDINDLVFEVLMTFDLESTDPNAIPLDDIERLQDTAANILRRFDVPRPDSIPTGDQLFDEAVAQTGHARYAVLRMLRAMMNRTPDKTSLNVASQTLRRASAAATALELAAEAYTFQAGRVQRTARQHLKRVKALASEQR